MEVVPFDSVSRHRITPWVSLFFVLLSGALFLSFLAQFYLNFQSYLGTTPSALGLQLKTQEDFESGSLKRILLEHAGGTWGKDAYYLDSGEYGKSEVVLPNNGSGQLKLRFWAYDLGPASFSIQIGSETFPIPGYANRGQEHLFTVNSKPVIFQMESHNIDSTRRLFLLRLDAGWFPPFANLPSRMGLYISFSAFFLSCFRLFSKVGFRVSKFHKVIFILLALISIVGFDLRLNAFDFSRIFARDPDSIGYANAASNMQWWTKENGFFSGNFGLREPLFIAGLNLCSKFFPNHSCPEKVFSLVLSGILPVISAGFVWALSGNWFMAVLSCMLIAFNFIVIDESCRGLRTEFEMILIIFCAWSWYAGRGWKGALLTGFLTGAFSLLRGSGIPTMLPVYWGAWVVSRLGKRFGKSIKPDHWTVSHLLIISIFAIGIYFPHLHAHKRLHGSYSYAEGCHFRYFLNNEFPEKFGSPGFPTREEFEKFGKYYGEPLSFVEYIFRYHNFAQFFKGQMKGWLESLVYLSICNTPFLKHTLFAFKAEGIAGLVRVMPLTSYLFIALFGLTTLLGVSVCLYSNKHWWIPLLAVWSTSYVAYLYYIRLAEPFRNVASAFPFVVICFCFGVGRLLSFAGLYKDSTCED